VVVENKPGGTVIGTDLVAKAAPDGHTIALVIPSLAVNPSIMAQLPYDTVKDLAGVTLISTLPIALFATPSLPVNNVAELVAYAKKNPKTLSYGSARLGSTSHLAGLMLNQLAGVDLVHVPYKGSAPAQQDLIGGRLTLLFDSFISQLPMVQAGRVKLVAPAGPRRLPGFPDAAPIGDTVKGFNVESYFGVIAPRATPPAVLAQIHQAIKKAMEDPAVSSWMATQGMVPAASHAGAVRRVHPGRHEKVGGGRQSHSAARSRKQRVEHADRGEELFTRRACIAHQQQLLTPAWTRKHARPDAIFFESAFQQPRFAHVSKARHQVGTRGLEREISRERGRFVFVVKSDGRRSSTGVGVV